jgi:hypothetical protein
VPSSLLRCCLALVALLIASGCALKGPATGLYVVATPTAEFFKYGPAQSFGPDFVLKKGDRLTMLERTWGFSKVQTENGLVGYVASEDVEPAPPSAAPRLAANTGRTRHSPIGNVRPSLPTWQKRAPSQFLGNPDDPLFNVDDVPLPMPDDAPASKARPQFRTTPPGGETPKVKPKFRG